MKWDNGAAVLTNYTLCTGDQASGLHASIPSDEPKPSQVRDDRPVRFAGQKPMADQGEGSINKTKGGNGSG